MQAPRKHTVGYIVIIISLFLALLPVILSNNYLRQDDLKTGIWWGMRISDGVDYYNTVMQLVRPLCMLLFHISDLLSINVHDAVFVRMASILNVCLLGVLLYRWHLLFSSNRFLAITFAIAAFTLPGIQLAAATANYFLMLFAILLAVGSAFCWHRSFFANTKYEKKKYLYIGNILFFCSFLDYPISSMYVWVLLLICYLNSLTSPEALSVRFKKFFYYAAFLAALGMGSYFIFMHAFHWYHHVDLNSGRVGHMHLLDILMRLNWIFPILIWHSLLWIYVPFHWVGYYPLGVILALLGLALAKIHGAQVDKSMRSIFYYFLMVPTILFLLFLMCYSPVFASPDNGIGYTFRYTLATQPVVLYVLLWSLSQIFKVRPIFANLSFIFIVIFGIYYAHTRIADGIVGPQESDFSYIQAQLNEKVVPLLRQNKRVALYVVDCEHDVYQFEKDVPIALEYAMRICAYPGHLIGAVNQSLMALGFTSNKRKINNAEQYGKVIILKDIPWGNMIVGSGKGYDMSHLDYPKEEMTLVTIDMHHAPSYKHLDFYKRLFSGKTIIRSG